MLACQKHLVELIEVTDARNEPQVFFITRQEFGKLVELVKKTGK